MFSNQASCASAVGAGRGRPDDRLAERQPIDADVQEAADDRADDGRGERSRAGVMKPARAQTLRLVRQRKERRSRRDAHAARRRRARRGCPSDRPERRAIRMARTTGSQSAGGRPSRAATASTICLELIDASSASAAASRRSASFRSQSISADCRIDSHIRRDDARSPPSASVVAASDRRNQGAPGTSLAF